MKRSIQVTAPREAPQHRYLVPMPALGLFGCLIALLIASLTCSEAQTGNRSHHVIRRPRAITQCPWDGTSFGLYDASRTATIGTYDLVTVEGRMLPTDSDGALFTFLRSGDVIFRKSVSDMYNQNGWLGVSDDRRSFALNTSNGGAAGGWSITILMLDEKGSIRDLTNSLQAVEKDFSSRHFCKARGDNYEAMKWQKNDQLLISASVYGTSDCGADMGHTEGYVLDVTTARIIAHYSEAELLNLPYVCTYNVWQPGDPQP
jgi:hypothetical protein